MIWIRKCAVLAVLVAALLPAAGAQASVGPLWMVMPEIQMPKGGTVAMQLRDVVAPAGGGVWAVGDVSWGASPNPLLAHFDGVDWGVVPVPGAGLAAPQYAFASIDATGGSDVWIVGSIRSSGTTAAALRFNGSWSVMPIPSAALDTTSALNGIDMLSGGDGWAVGWSANTAGATRATILRWQAGQWISVAAPATGAVEAELNSVRALSGTDAWAVGSQTLTDGRRVGLVLHWDGLGWQEVPLPDAGTGDQELTGVDASAPAQVWVVGRACQPSTPTPSCEPQVLRLVDDKWEAVSTVGRATELTDVIAFSSSDVWIFGYAKDTQLPETHHVEHWNGTRFDTDGGAFGMGTNDSEPASALAAASASSPHELWAVGWSNGPSGPISHTIRRL